MSKHTDTPKYIGSVGKPEEFYDRALLLEGNDSFTELEQIVLNGFAANKAIEASDGADYTGMSEIYVRSREVQKLVRAVDTLIEARAAIHAAEQDQDRHVAMTYLGAAINQLDEARAALADIK
jgi:hypothetical protein